MSIATYSIPLDSITHLTLEQCISPSATINKNLRFFQLTNTDLKVETGLCTADFPLQQNKETIPQISVDPQEALELVVLGQTSIGQLQGLVTDSNIKINGLSRINNRNQQSSYRFQVTCQNPGQSRQLLAQFSLKHKIEAALLKDAPSLSKPGLLVMDMDSTTIEVECIDEIAALAGVGQQVAEVTELAMQGKLDFTQSLVQRVARLRGAPESVLAEVARDIPLMPGLKILVGTLKQHQWRVAIASGGFTYFADHLCQLLELDGAFANELEIIDGKLTGKVTGDIVDAKVKAQTLKILSDKFALDHRQTVAMGDGANDLVMMNSAALGVAFKAKPLVLEQADVSINHSGLDCLLHYLK
ncbi:phosphoserine phosphatase SerB [Thalassomonas actiniarum]|uniref:phosphoserine phosphatase SerB n=1 Tax=Thalassomonas actiniarum TaxID=485447 RepID=UPI000B3226BF|nr:phosphoserine phosphatase SerB [Thalassomonas actiniarum]